MFNVMNVQPNVPKAVINEYFFLVYGVGKSGKTTLLYNLAQTDYVGGLDKMLLLGFEKGYKALNGIHAVDIDGWYVSNATNEARVEKGLKPLVGFVNLVDQLIENAHQISYKLLGLDTLDYMYQFAEEYVVARERKASKGKVKAISDIAWGKGYQMVTDEVDKQIKRLQRIGLGIFAITHDKEKKIELKSGESYDKTTLTLSDRAKNLFVNMADFILYISIDKVVDKNDNVFETRHIHFRSNGDVEAGSRFEDVPDKIPYDVDIFIETFEKAVLSSFNEDKKAMEKAKKIQIEERAEEAIKYVESEIQSEKSLEDLVKEVEDAIGELEKEDQTKLKAFMKSNFKSIAFKKYDDAEKLNKTLEFIASLVEVQE